MLGVSDRRRSRFTRACTWSLNRCYMTGLRSACGRGLQARAQRWRISFATYLVTNNIHLRARERM